MSTDDITMKSPGTDPPDDAHKQGANLFRIRAARSDDIPAMHAIRMAVRENRLSDPGWLTPEVYAAYLHDSGTSDSWVCEEEGRIVGFVVARLIEKDIWALFVDPAHESRGIGQGLIRTATEWLFAHGAAEASLSTMPDTRADAFYRKNGWIRGERTKAGEVTYRLSKAGAILELPAAASAGTVASVVRKQRTGVVHALSRSSPHDTNSDLRFWKARPIPERIGAALDIRNDHHFIDDETESRLERVLVRIECR